MKVILSRPQPNTGTVQSCMCELKYIHLLTAHGPSIAQSASKQSSFSSYHTDSHEKVHWQSTVHSKTNPVCVSWKMKLYRPFADMGDMVLPSAVQLFQVTTWTLGTVESHTQSSPVHVNWHEITQLEYGVQYGMLELDLYLTKDIWLYREGRIHTVTRLCVKPANYLALIWVMTPPFQSNCYKITWLWNTGRPHKISSVKTHWVNRYMQRFLTFRKWI
jgi:hypothetical protein